MNKAATNLVLWAIAFSMVLSGSTVPQVGLAENETPNANGYDFSPGATLIPMGDQQSNPREAYKFVFQRVFSLNEVQWTAEDIVHEGVTYPAGTFVTKAGVNGPFTHVKTTTPVTVTKAFSLNKVKIALFSSLVQDSKGQSVTWETIYFESLFKTYLWGNSYFTEINEATMITGSLSDYDMLILPSISKGYVNSVVSALGTDGLANLASFVNDGGMVYAQGDSSYLAEAAGLVGFGTTSISKRVSAINNEAALVFSGSSPLTFSLLSDKMYILQDPLFRSSDTDAIVATYSSSLMDPTHIGSPAILSYGIGSGRLVMISGHPSEKSDLLPLVLNAVLWGLSGKADVRNYVTQTYNPSLPWYLIPGREENVQMTVYGTFSNYWDTLISNVEITDVVESDFWVDQASINPAPTGFDDSGVKTIITWNFDSPQGDFPYSYNVFTGPGGVDKGWMHVSGSWLNYQDPDSLKDMSLVRNSLYIKSAMPAYLLGDRDIELDGVYPIPANGWYFDMAFPLENKEETDALNTIIVDIVPLQSPVVDVVDQTRIPGALFDSNFGTNNTVMINNTIFFYANANYPLPDGVTDPNTEFTVADADTTYIYDANGENMVLPAKKLTWTYGTIRAWDHKEPMIRYGIFTQEEFHRTVSFISDPIPGSVIMNASGGSVYTALGGHPIPYHEYLQHGIIYIPEYPEPPRVDYQDIWMRDHTLELRTVFYDVVPFPPPEEHAVITSTFEMTVNGERVLDYPMDKQADLHVMVKSWNGYPPYDPILYPYHMDMIRNETLIRQVVPKGLGYEILYEYSDFSPNTEIADIVETNTSYIIYYRQDLNASEKEVIDVYSTLKNIDHDEGTMKINDGARFVYRQIAVGPSRYEVHDNHVAVVWGVQNNLDLTNVIAPVDIGTYGDEVFNFLKVEDPNEPQQLADPYIKSYGFGNISATTYVGGRIEKTLLFSKLEPGEKTMIRVEIDNNLGYDLTNISLIASAPPEFTVEPAIFDIPPIWFDFPFLDATNIWDAWKGVYYFNVTASNSPPADSLGLVYSIDLTLEGDNIPSDFEVPAALVGIKDAGGQALMTYGRATNLKLQQTVPNYVDIIDTRIANAAEKAELEYWVAMDNQIMIDATFYALRSISHDSTPSGNYNIVDYNLPAYASTIPWLDYGVETHEPLFVISRAMMQVSSSGVNRATFSPKLVYDDHFSKVKVDWGRSRNVRAHGPEIITNPMIEKISVGNLEREFLSAGAPNNVLAKLYVANLGDDIAESVRVKAVIPEGVALLSSQPAYSYYNVATGGVEWTLGDIGPRGQIPIALEFLAVPPIPTGPTAFYTLLETVYSHFTHMYLQQQVVSDTVGPPALNALVMKDIDPPDAPVLDPILTPTNNPVTTVTGTTEPDAIVEIYRNSALLGSVLADANGDFSMSILLLEGGNTITAKATDVLGNGPSAESAAKFVLLDTIAPGAPKLDPLPKITSEIGLLVNGEAEAVSSVEVFVDGVSAGTNPADSSGGFAHYVLLTEGDNAITARASDTLGNVGPFANPVSVKLDTIAPEATIDYVSADKIIKGRTVFLTGHGQDANAVVGYKWISSKDGVLSDQASFSTSELSLGIHSISFSVMDEVGHWSAKVTTQITVKVSTGPVVNVIVVEEATEDEPVEFNGFVLNSDGDIAKYEWDFDGDGIYDWQSETNGFTVHTYYTPGKYTAFFRVTDQDGDVSLASASIDVKEDVRDNTAEVALFSVMIGVLAFLIVLFVVVYRRSTKGYVLRPKEEKN
jgi:hypothetical protein